MYSFVFIRGLVREAGHWGEFLDSMKSNFPGSTLHCIDLPGAGIHFKKTTPLTVAGIVQHMRNDFKDLGLPSDRPVVLVAVSLGGMIAAQWMQDYPKDFQFAVLMNTSYRNFSPVWKRLKPEALLKLIKVPILKGEAKEHRILEVVSNSPEKYQKTAHEWGRIGEKRPVSLENTLRQLAAAAQFRTSAEKPSVPVLLIGAPMDRMVDVSCTREIAKAWNVPAVEHPTAGHDIATDDPNWIATKVHEWLTDVNAARSSGN